MENQNKTDFKNKQASKKSSFRSTGKRTGTWAHRRKPDHRWSPPSPFLAGPQAPQSQRKPQSGFLGWAEAWLCQRNQSYSVFYLSIKKDQIWGSEDRGERIHSESSKLHVTFGTSKEGRKDTWRESWKWVVWTLVLRSHSTLRSGWFYLQLNREMVMLHTAEQGGEVITFR